MDVINRKKTNKKLKAKKQRIWNCFPAEFWQQNVIEAQMLNRQVQYETGMAMAETTNFNTFQPEPFQNSCWHQPQYEFSTLPVEMYENPPTEDRTAFPSFRFMKVRKKVRICSSDPRTTLSYQQLESLSFEILERVLSEESSEFKPRFYGVGITNGCLLTVCGDDTTLFWLKKVIRELRTAAGLRLVLLVESEEEKMYTAVGYFQQSQQESNERILRFLENQNGLDVSRWKITNRALQNSTIILTLLVDFESAELLKLKGELLNYKFGAAKFFVGQEEKFKEEIEDDISQYPNPFAFSNPNLDVIPVPSDRTQIPIAISSYFEQYKTGIEKMVSESKNLFLKRIAIRENVKANPPKKKNKKLLLLPTSTQS